MSMQAADSKIAIKFLPSLLDFAFLMPMAFLFGRMDGMQNLLGDCDTGWHIRTGEWIAANRAVPARDLFSYSKPGGAWFAWEWLSDLIFAWLNAHGGLAAVALAAVLLISTVFALLFLLARQKSNVLIALAVTMAAAAASSIHWLARPHLFTLLFTVLFYGALERVRGGRARLAGVPYLAILPAATILWTNLHGGFVAGIAMVGAYGCGELLRFVLSPGREEAAAARAQAARYFACALACLAASLVNPYTYHLHQHVIEYLGDSYQSQHIMEFLSLSFHHPIAIFFEAMLLLAAGAAFTSFRDGTYTEAVLLLVWAHGALLAARNIPLFMIVAAPPVAAMLAAWCERAPQWNVAAWVGTAVSKFNRLAAEMTASEDIPRWHVISLGGAALVALLLFAPHPPKKFRPEFDPKSYPAAAVTALALEPASRIFTFDQWGDYLIYRLYPRTRVFIDGRSDFYGSDFEQKYVDALNVKYGWEETLAKFGVDTILLPPSTPLTGALKECSRWRLVYDDGVALVFRSVNPNSPANPDNSANPDHPVHRVGGRTVSAVGGNSRDREITKTQAGGVRATQPKSTT